MCFATCVSFQLLIIWLASSTALRGIQQDYGLGTCFHWREWWSDMNLLFVSDFFMWLELDLNLPEAVLEIDVQNLYIIFC